jgi:signal transduction histidine kinase/ActR/RegA family two-component response regulator
MKAHAIRDGVHLDENAVLNLIVAQDMVEKALAKVRLISLRAQVADSIDYLLQNDLDLQTRDLTLKIRDRINNAYENQDRLIEIVSTNESAEAISYYQTVVKPDLRELAEQCELFTALQETERDKHYQIATQVYSRSRTIFIAVSSLLLVLSVWLCFIITKSITRPIEKAVMIASSLSENNFDVEMDVSEAGEPGRLLAAMKQMAERLNQVKALEQQLIQVQKLETVGKLAGGVAHDFNNLLTAIYGHCELALMEPGGQPSARGHIEDALQAAQRAGALTRQLLAFSRRQVLKPEVIDLNRLVCDLRKMMDRLIPENIEMRLNCREDIGSVKVDQSQLEQVILNLVVNARDAMPDGGRLLIETDQAVLDEQCAASHAAAIPGRYAVISVSDTGTGMTPEVQARVFEPFFTTKELGRGTGLGLSTVYGIVKQSGGNIWVYSEPGLGTTFKVYLPIVSESATAAEPTKPPPLQCGFETILLVEDDPEVRKVAAILLSEQGYHVRVAEHAQAAIGQAAAANPPVDLLLTDVVMPGMNGKALAEHILMQNPHTAVLYMSGYTDQMLTTHAVMNNGFNFIQKPFTAEALLAKVRSTLDAARGAAG